MVSRRIKGITIQIDGETKGLDKALSDVNQRTRDVNSELSQIEKLLKFNPGNAELVEQQHKVLAERVEVTAEKLRDLKDAEAEVQRQFDEGKITGENYREFQRQIVETESKLEHFRGELKKTTSKAEKVGKGLQKAGKGIKATGASVRSAGNKMTGFITGPITAAGAAIVKVGKDFEEGMSKVEAVSGETGDNLERLRKKAIAVGKDSKFSPTEIAEGFEYMARTGWDAEEMLGGIEGAVHLATISGEDFGEVTDILTDSLSAFGLEAEDSGRFVDVLAAATTSSNSEISDLGKSFEYVAPKAGGLGLEIEDVALQLALMADDGIKADKAGTALRTMMDMLGDDTSKANKELENLGISAFNSEGELRPLTDIVEDLRNKTDHLTDAKRSTLLTTMFGREAATGIAILLNTNAEKTAEVKKEIDEANGSASEMSDIMRDNLQGSLDDLNSSIQAVAIELYEHLAPAIREIIDFITKLVDGFGDLPESMQGTIVKVAALVAVIGPLLIALGLFIELIGTAAGGLGTIIRTFGAVSRAIPLLVGGLGTISAPVWVVIGVFAALVAAGVAIYKNWDVVKAKSIEIWEGISTFLSETIESISESFNEWFEPIKEFVVGIWDSIVTGTIEKWNAISEFLSEIFDVISKVFSLYFDPIAKFVTETWTTVSETTTRIWNGITNILDNVLTIIKNLYVGAFRVFLQIISGSWEDAWETTVHVWNNIWEAIGSILESIGDIFRAFFGSIWEIGTGGLEALHTIFVENFIKIKDVIVKYIKEAWVSFWKGLSDMKESAIEYMGGIWKTITETFKEIVKYLSEIDLKQIGIDMIKGLINGITSMIGDAKKAVTGVVDGLIETTGEILKIKSPSRVFHEIGEFTGEGLEQGILSMGGRVQRASETLAEQTIVTADSNVDMSVSGRNQDNGGSGSSNNTQGVGDIVINIDNMSVTDESDILKISRKLKELIDRDNRGRGGGL